MIKITNISKTFSGNQVLNDISLEIEEGDVVALIGASGAGKSTFLRALNDLERPDSGQIEIDDLKIDYSTITKQDNPKNYFFIFFHIFYFSNRENSVSKKVTEFIRIY